MTVRPATQEDLPAIRAIAAESPGVPCPENPLEWPAIECPVVELDGEIIGFGYLEAIPEGHLLFRRSSTTREQRREGIRLLVGTAGVIAKKLNLAAVRLPVTVDLPDLAIWMSGLPHVQPDPRVHLALVLPGGKK